MVVTIHKICTDMQESHETQMIAKGLLLGYKGCFTASTVEFLKRVVKRKLYQGTFLPTEVWGVKELRKSKYYYFRKRGNHT